jgi:hypothetical protein
MDLRYFLQINFGKRCIISRNEIPLRCEGMFKGGENAKARHEARMTDRKFGFLDYNAM